MKTTFRGPLTVFCLSVSALLSGCAGGSGSSTGTTQPPAASITVASVSPMSVLAGSSALAITVTGSGFGSGTTLQVGSTTVAATVASSTQLTASVPAVALGSAGYLAVVAANGSSSSASTGAAVNLEVDNPVPAVTAFSPLAVAAGASATVISVIGTGFVPTTSVQVSRTARTTAYVSGTQVNVTLTAADLAAAGTISFSVVNPSPGGGMSTASLPVTNQAPGPITISPSTIPAGVTTATTITVTGSNFQSTTVAQFNGSSRPTTVTSTTQLSFQLTVADQATAGKASITVATPAPGGGSSAAVMLTIATPTATPILSSVSPTSFVLNSPGYLLVYGSNLTANSVVQWNGSPLTTSSYNSTYSGTYLGALVPSSLLTTAGTASITVSAPTALAVSNALPVSIVNPPAPTLTSALPAGAPLGTATVVTLTGTGFSQTSTVQFDGSSLTATFVSSTSLTVTVPASAVPLPGNHSFIVTTPSPGGGASGSLTFTSYIAIANNAMAMNPVSGLLYVSVPSSAGAPYGNSVVSVDPASGAIGTPIPVGSEPDKLAISADGTTLWVGLDGASAIRQVNLSTGTAGPQYSLGGNTGTYDYPPVVHAISVLPGTTTSIVASITSHYGLYNDVLAIFDNGVERTNTVYLSTLQTLPAIFVNPVKAEVYATSEQTGYQVLSYDSTGLKPLAGNTGSNNFGANYGTALQVDNGRAYLDTGLVLDAETGTQLGTFYSTGTTVAVGPNVSDSSLGKNFILSGTTTYNGVLTGANQIQAYSESTFASVIPGSIPVSGAITGSKYGSTGSSDTTLNANNNIDTLLRWGANGLVFRGANGVFSIRSNVVQDLSATNADLAVTTSAPAAAATGASATVTSTITNNGPSSATAVTFVAVIPPGLTLISAVGSQGSCSTAVMPRCNLGLLANGASARVTLTLQVVSAGAAAITSTVVADQNDPTGSNNSSTATITLTGNTYAAVPVITTLSPNAALAGSTDVTLTVNGTGFVSNSVVNLGSSALNSTYISATQMMAVVPASQLTTLGWLSLSVATPAPGGGTSNAAPFSIYQVVSLTANHLIADPYSRNLYASINSTATQGTGNTVTPINPVTGSLGTPIAVGSQPTVMAETDDGQYLYLDQPGSSSVGRVNLLTQMLEFSFPITAGSTYYSATPALRGIATQPGSDTTVAADEGSYIGVALWDVNAAQKTATQRSSATGIYEGGGPQFLNATNLFTFDSDSTGAELYHYSVTPTGLIGSYTTAYTLNNFSAFKIRAGLAYANNGGVANPASVPVAPLGVFLSPSASTYVFSTSQVTEPDPSLGRSFFASVSTSGTTPGAVLRAFDQATYLQTDAVTLPTLTASSSSAPTPVDLVRWGSDGLAFLTSTGQIVLLRGPFVVPQLLATNTAATLTASSITTLAHGSGNVTLTLTGTNFVPGVAVNWNGSYRTTTITDGTHLSVAIPASDLAGAGTGTVTAINPGGVASNGLTVTIN